jgi:hypothetical protein
MTTPNKPIRVVVCAANRYNGSAVLLGARHFDSLMCDALEEYEVAGGKFNRDTEEQGFIDQWGIFMDRTEALSVATAAGQINTRRPKGNPTNILFSEDLY